MAGDLVNTVIIENRKCNSLRKIARLTRQLKNGGNPIDDTKIIGGRKLFLHPTKGYRQGPHYPMSAKKAAIMRRGRALIAALVEDTAA